MSESYSDYAQWNPTPEEFERYLQREVELAVLNMQAAAKKSADPKETVFGTHLHSAFTVSRAAEIVRR